jgi:phage shock protein A
MNAWQRLRMQIAAAARVIFHDLFGEEDPGEAVPAVPSIQLGAMQAQLDALAPELARFEGRWQQMEDERERLAADLADLDEEIDRALLCGADDLARRLARRKLDLAGQLEDLTRRSREQARIATDARAVVQRLGQRCAETRRQLAGLSASQQDAAALEHIVAVRRELEDALASLETSGQFNERGEKV